MTQTGTEITETSMVSQATSSAAQQAPRYLHMTMKRHIPFLPRADGLLTFTMNGVFTQLVKPQHFQSVVECVEMFPLFLLLCQAST